MIAATVRTALLALALCLPLAAPAADGTTTGAATAPATDQAGVAEKTVAGAFLALVLGGPDDIRNSLAWIDANWEAGMVPMALETIRLTRTPMARLNLLDTMQKHTGQTFSVDIRAWQVWWWNLGVAPASGYREFKSVLYGLIDPPFKRYFEQADNSAIDLDEVIWGGVRQDGIPPLHNPTMLPAAEATYLADDNVVFGISVNGDARAYPKRILAWHEMFTDTVGGIPVAGVYCTLCGTVVLYHTTAGGTRHELGTSGFLYRSNKLMFDHATQSLWSTMRGTPVMGPLVGKDIALTRGSVVTTTWSEWRQRHPDTTVLSLETGHRRDYGEGVAYKSYFATDDVMFTVPKRDDRLANKAEVLALRTDRSDRTIAIAADFLSSRPVHHETLADQPLVILTDPSGANRVYATGMHTFASYDPATGTALDDRGGTWRVKEDALVGPDDMRLARVPAHRAFWFGWFAAFPETRLVY